MNSARIVVPVLALLSLAATGAAPDARAQEKRRDVAVIENDLVADAADVRAKAAAELGARFPDGAVAVPMLVDLLDDPDRSVGAAAAQSLDALAVDGAGALADFFRDEAKWKGERALAVTLPVLFGLKGPEPLDAIDEERETRRQPMAPGEAALAALLAHAPDAPAFGKLAAEAKSRGAARTIAAAALAMHGADVLAARGLGPFENASRTSAGNALLPLLRHATDVRAWIGASVAARVRSGDAAMVDLLTQTLTAAKTPLSVAGKPSELHARAAACSALGRIGTPAAGAVPKLLEIAGSGDAGAAAVSASAAALLRLGRESDVLALLGTSPPTTSLLEAALARERRAADVVVPRLIARFEKTNGAEGESELVAYGREANDALRAIKKPEPREELGILHQADVILAIAPYDIEGNLWLEQVIESRDRKNAWLARRVADQRLPGGSDNAAKVKAWLARPGTTRATAIEFCRVLGRCGPDARFAVPGLLAEFPALEKAVLDPGAGPAPLLLRRDLCRALGLIGPGASDAVPALTALRDKGDETIRVVAALALRRINAK